MAAGAKRETAPLAAFERMIAWRYLRSRRKETAASVISFISFLGIIGFVGLVVPHMIRRVIGSDHRFLLPCSAIGGALLLLASDTAARLILAPHILPVSVLTAFSPTHTVLTLLILLIALQICTLYHISKWTLLQSMATMQ